MNIQQAIVYDVEVLPNVFTLNVQSLNYDDSFDFEISDWKQDNQLLVQWFNQLHQNQIPMIGFNNELYDYIICHFIMQNPNCTAAQIYEMSQRIINSNNRYEFSVWQNKRFAPQIDLFKIQHFDNTAKRTSLKALEINMRSSNVVEVLGNQIQFDQFLSREQIDEILIPYNRWDVSETKKFAHICKKPIEFRLGLLGKLPGDVMNFNDTKIGAKILEDRLGDAVCYDRSSGRREPKQTFRHKIPLRDVIFPYVHFEHPEFKRVFDWMMQQELTSDDIENPDAKIKTKGVFSDVKAFVGGMSFDFGTGGIHGSIEPQIVQSDENTLIEDIDVVSLYPSIAVENNLSPEHMGDVFTKAYSQLLIERKSHKKGTVENGSLKLALNGTYGNSNNMYSVFYDPKLTMSITINGQLMLCMLAEKLLSVPTLQFIQINTDGITYKIDKQFAPLARHVAMDWEKLTRLQLESAHYSRMWIRDVNNYVAEYTNGKLKQKGAYWHPDALDYNESINNAGPPAWHKDFNPVVVTRAAVQAMVNNVDPVQYIMLQHDPFDFMCRIKVQRGSNLILGNQQIQNTTRYYVSRTGYTMKRVSPPTAGCEIGQYKRKNKLSDSYFNSVLNEIGPGVWDERIHTKNKSTYQNRETEIQKGFKIRECNNASDFNFADVDYDWYIAEARKLIIS